MTTRKELGEMLITGKPMQEKELPDGSYGDMSETDECFDIGWHDYRLKPTITYYRVFLGLDGSAMVWRRNKPFKPWLDTPHQTHIHDFQIEE